MLMLKFKRHRKDKKGKLMKRILSVFFAFFMTIACAVTGGVFLADIERSQLPTSNVYEEENDEKKPDLDEEDVSAQASTTIYTSSAYNASGHMFNNTYTVGQKYILELSLTGSISNSGNASIVLDAIKKDHDSVDWNDRKATCEIHLSDLNTQRKMVVEFVATSTEATSCDKLNLWYAQNGASPNLSAATMSIKVWKNDPTYINFDAENLWQGYESNPHINDVKFIEYIDDGYIATSCEFTTVRDGGVFFRQSRLTVGETYLWSVQVKSTRSHMVNIGQEQGGRKDVTITTSWQTFTHEFVATDSQYECFIIYYNFANGEVLNVRGLTIQKKNLITSSAANSTRVVWKNETYGTLPNPTKTGYTLDGWWTSSNGGLKKTSTTKVTSFSNQVLYARWIKNVNVPSRPYFTANANGGTANEVRDYQINSISLTYYGYGFAPNSAGWFESQNKGFHNSYSMMKISFQANARASFTIRYISYSESNYDYAIFGNLDQILNQDHNEDSSFFKRTYGESSPSEKTITYSNISAGTHSIYVKYKKDGSNNSNNDSLQLFFESDLQSMPPNQRKWQFQGLRYGTLPTATKAGNKFDGWWTNSTGGTRITENTIYNGLSTIYAHWIPNDYLVSYDANGGTLTQQVGKNIIESGFDSTQTYTLQSGVSVPTLRSNYMNLTQGKTYGVSFKYWTDSGTQEFNIDFFPDTLPQYTALRADTTKRTFDWSVTLNHSDASSCQVRFFHDFRVENSVHISDIVIYEATPGTEISTGFSSSEVYTLNSGVSVPTLRGNYMNLTQGKTYRVSFCYWTVSGSQSFQIDFYPDSLPETSATADTIKRTFNWIVTLNHSDANSCMLRFFNGISVSNTVYITNIRLYELSSPTSGVLTYRNMSNGTPYGSAPYSNNMPQATKPYYELKGWYTARSGGTKVLSTSNYSLAEDQKLFAQWAPVAITNHIYIRVLSMDGNTMTQSTDGGIIDLYRYVLNDNGSSAGNHTQTIASQQHVVHQGQEFRITAKPNSGYVFAGFSTSPTLTDSIKNPSSSVDCVGKFNPTANTNYYVYFKKLSDNRLKYDEVDKYFYFEDGYYPQSEALEEMFTINDYKKDWKAVETTYYAGQRYILEVSLEGTILNPGNVAIVIDAVKKGNDSVDHNDRQVWCEVRLTHLIAEKHVRIAFTANSHTESDCYKLQLWYANNGTTNEDFSNAKVKVRVLKSLDKIIEKTAIATGEFISFNDGTTNVDNPIFSYNGEKYVKVSANEEAKWFKFEPIRWRISDYGIAKTERNIARYKTLLKFKDYSSFSNDFVAVSDLILGVGAMHNTRDVREGDSVQELTGFQNVQNMTDNLANDSLKLNYNKTGIIINVDEYSGYGNGQTNSVNKNNTTSYSAPFRITSLAELNEVGYVNRGARASDMVAFILGQDKNQVSYWTRDLSNLGSGIAITPTGTQIQPWLDEMLGMRFTYTFSEGSTGAETYYKRINYIRSTGSQWIDTGWSTTTGMICEFQADWQTSGYIVGSHGFGEPFGRNGAYIDFDRGFWELGFGEECYQNTTYERMTNKKYFVKFSTVSGDAYLDVNGGRLLSSTGTQTTTSENVVFFTSNGYWSGKFTEARLYMAKIWTKDRVLKFDFVPVQNIFTGEIGLWDNVSGRFFGNSGTGNFLAL